MEGGTPSGQASGGESLDDVRVRAMAALEEVIRNHPGKTLVFVSHRVVNKVLICGILGLDNPFLANHAGYDGH